MATLSEALTIAVQHHQAGRLQAAEEIYRQILSFDPNQADALHLLGLIALQVGRHESAIELIERAIRLHGTSPEFHNHVGEAYRALRRYPEAIACFQRALQLKPDFAGVHSNMGLALYDQGRLNGAVASFQRALQLVPNFANALNNLAMAWRDLGRLNDAVACFQQALNLQPSAAGFNNLGSVLAEQGQFGDAEACLKQALQLKPDYAAAYVTLGNTLRYQRKFGDAVACYQKALQIEPGYADAHNNLGTALQVQGDLEQAILCYQRALQFAPDLAAAHNNLGNVWKDEGSLAKAIASFRNALKFKPNYVEAHSNLAYSLNFCAEYDAQTIFEEHRRWNQIHAEPLMKGIKPHGNDRSPERRLRIGYVSPDLMFHPVGRFMLPLLQAHDKETVEIFCYASLRSPDETTERCRAHADRWRHVLGLSDEQLAQTIRQDGIDILVDLSMHTANNRMLLFARKPAPVQVTYLAYCGTTGLRAVDYRLTDPYLDPPGQNDRRYSETSIWLPETYWCYGPPSATQEVNSLPALENKRATFGCFNNFCKVTEPTLLAWSRLLQTLPEARLLLQADAGSHRDRVLEFFNGCDVARERITFVAKVPIAEYLRFYERIDVALDPFPYGGGTTTCDALWMGVPVVTLAGQTAVGRGGLSIVSNVGLADLCAHNTDQYVRIAADLANDLPRLRELRGTLRERMQASPLMDAPRFARAVEAAYRDMWQRWCRKKK